MKFLWPVKSTLKSVWFMMDLFHGAIVNSRGIEGFLKEQGELQEPHCWN